VVWLLALRCAAAWLPLLQAQNSLFGHLGFHGLRCPAAEPTLADSRLIVSEQLPGGVSKVRLLKFVPGETLKASSKASDLWMGLLLSFCFSG
jgi:Ser/Thr protein kinase RdoA (MazF antagonist)